MSRLRIPILGMMTIVVALAMAFAALRSASDFWFSTFYTLSLIVLLVALISARYRRGAERAFWFGFSVFGWGFFMLGSGRLMIPAFSSDSDIVGINPHLLTSKVAAYLVAHLRQDTDDVSGIDEITENTYCIVHLLMTLGLAIVGGALAVSMRSCRRRKANSKPERTASAISLGILALLLLIPGLGALGSGGTPVARFFPPQQKDGPGGISEFRNKWYSKHVAAMGEPSLWGLSRDDHGAEAYRYLALPSFDHPIGVRITRRGTGAALRVVVLSGAGGYKPGHVAIDRTLSLDAGQWAELQEQIEAANFWSLPTKEPKDSGNDGTQFIVEGVRAGRYHVVDRWEPDPSYKKLIGHIFGLSGLKMRGG
jgi:hypothetical protein